MSDRVTVKVRGLDRSIERMRRLVPALDAEMDLANEKSVQEFVEIARHRAPRSSGEHAGTYARSINGRKIEGEVSLYRTGLVKPQSAWGVFASWIWPFLEFGTRRTAAQPHLFSTRRLLAKRHNNRMRRALSKAIKKAYGK